jgi:hypothetical protein
LTITLEHFLFGLFPDETDGKDKIQLYPSPNIYKVLTDRNYQILREFQPDSNGKYSWLPDEQAVALHHIEMVEDAAGRTWTRNHTLIVPIHVYLKLSNPFKKFKTYLKNDLEKPVDGLHSIVIDEE